jgi:hypothetical protein
MTVRSLAPRVALASAAAVAAVTFSSPVAVAAPAPPEAPCDCSVGWAGGTDLAGGADLMAVARSTTRLGHLSDEGRPYTFTVNVARAGTYRVSYFVSYPDVPGRLRTVVDGRRLPDTVSPVRAGTFGVNAATKPFALTAGKHTFRLTGVSFPSTLGAMADLTG